MQAGSSPPTGLSVKSHDPWVEQVLTLPLPLFLPDQQTAAADRQGPLSGFPQRGNPDCGWRGLHERCPELLWGKTPWGRMAGLLRPAAQAQWAQQPWPSVEPLLLRQSGGWLVTILRNNCILFGGNWKRSNCLPTYFYTRPCAECFTCNFLLNPSRSIQS